MAAKQHRETIEIAAGRGAIYDRSGVQLAIGEQATTIYANPRQVTDPRREAQRAGAILGVTLAAARRAARRPPARLRLRRAQGRSGDGGEADEAPPARSRLVSGGAPRLPAAHGRRAACSATRASTTTASAASSSRSTSSSPASRAGRRSSRIPSAARSTSSARRPSARAATSTSRSTTRSSRRPRACSATTIAKYRAKDATAIVLDPRTGAVLAMAVAPTFDANRYPDAARVGPAQPRDHGHLRARLDVQARHGRGRALARGSSPRRRRSCSRTRSTSPTA